MSLEEIRKQFGGAVKPNITLTCTSEVPSFWP